MQRSSDCLTLTSSPSSAMGEKLEKIHRWLAAAFGDEPIPPFEVNARTVSILEQLASSGEATCRRAELLAQDWNHKASEYQADGAHLQEVLLQSLGVSYASLPESCVDYLASLVDSAMVLATRDTSLSSLMPALNRLTNEFLEAEKSERKLDRELLALWKMLSATLVLRGQLQADVSKVCQAQAVERAKVEERILNMDFLEAKAKEICTRHEGQEAKLATRKMEDQLSHQALVQLSEEVTALKKEMIPLKKKLEPFLDLSASPSLACIKIEEAKRELAALDSRLETYVDFK
ncbi:HAUS augmin-like complex subunit 1 [Syngnathoides biaculeatus]|uniref:HAUS augmin-like complex subunit 1 n=1 Tax=Syngnathoides biaculeatus TaxID=300417 RepID=UPI002ADD9B2E|nr:HAUS augmin-like complex subunit 1 [Syngnathoides biaculeatus]